MHLLCTFFPKDFDLAQMQHAINVLTLQITYLCMLVFLCATFELPLFAHFSAEM